MVTQAVISSRIIVDDCIIVVDGVGDNVEIVDDNNMSLVVGCTVEKAVVVVNVGVSDVGKLVVDGEGVTVEVIKAVVVVNIGVSDVGKVVADGEVVIVEVIEEVMLGFS